MVSCDETNWSLSPVWIQLSSELNACFPFLLSNSTTKGLFEVIYSVFYFRWYPGWADHPLFFKIVFLTFPIYRVYILTWIYLRCRHYRQTGPQILANDLCHPSESIYKSSSVRVDYSFLFWQMLSTCLRAFGASFGAATQWLFKFFITKITSRTLIDVSWMTLLVFRILTLMWNTHCKRLKSCMERMQGTQETAELKEWNRWWIPCCDVNGSNTVT